MRARARRGADRRREEGRAARPGRRFLQGAVRDRPRVRTRSWSAPSFPKAAKSVFLELARRQGDYAIVGLGGAPPWRREAHRFLRRGGNADPAASRDPWKRQESACRCRSRRPLQLVRPPSCTSPASSWSAHGPDCSNHADSQRHAGDAQRPAAPAPGRFPARGARADRLAHRLRARRVRRVHAARERRNRARLPDARGAGERLPRGHHRGPVGLARSWRSCRRRSTRRMRCSAGSARPAC